MKHKKRSVCNNCRRRKLGCDGKQPGCSQCSLTGRACDGYSTAWKFIQQDSFKNSEGFQRRHATPTKGRDISPRPLVKLALDSPPAQWINSAPILDAQIDIPPSVHHLLNVIVENYLPATERHAGSPALPVQQHPRICGTWVEVLYDLPCVTKSNTVLSKSVTALAGAVLASVTVSRRSFSEPYLAAIRSLRRTLENGGGSSDELIPSIMCLILVEVMIPNAATALEAHLKAVGTFFELCGPKSCRSGLLHRLFIGFRPLMIIHAIQHRQPTFLGFSAWMDIPFEKIAPSIMQAFLSDFVGLSSLLHEVDCLTASRADQSDVDWQTIMLEFSKMSAQLDHWETSLKDSPQSYWLQGRKTDEVQDPCLDDRLIYFPNVTMANIFTHLWTFKIICIQEISSLNMNLSTGPENPYRTPPPDNCAVALARKISLSMDYLLKEDMGLFGPASSSFPLQKSWQVLKKDGNVSDHMYLETIVHRLTQRGLLSAPVLIFGPDLHNDISSSISISSTSGKTP